VERQPGDPFEPIHNKQELHDFPLAVTPNDQSVSGLFSKRTQLLLKLAQRLPMDQRRLYAYYRYGPYGLGVYRKLQSHHHHEDDKEVNGTVEDADIKSKKRGGGASLLLPKIRKNPYIEIIPIKINFRFK
jgi:hypothetical protein